LWPTLLLVGSKPWNTQVFQGFFFSTQVFSNAEAPKSSRAGPQISGDRLLNIKNQSAPTA
jgi:hypothetical protein